MPMPLVSDLWLSLPTEDGTRSLVAISAN